MRIVKPSARIESPSPLGGLAMMYRIELAGRTCYKSECKMTPGGAAEFVAKIMRLGHESVLEHESISVRFICDRGVSHEIVRHRIASYSQESTRYCDYGKAGEIQVIEPPGLNPQQRYQWVDIMQSCETAYNNLRALGCSPQIARSVLPNSLKTELVMTANLREWRHFFKLRCSPAAHPQMREVAIPLLREFQQVLPIIFGDLYPVEGVPCQS
jgi:thymidylate synthase (FAD)